MKIGITGHTKGIGKSLYTVFEENNHTVIGFSRSNDFDIGEFKARKKIINNLHDIDVFINNAYHPTGQLETIKSVIDFWKNTNKIIINISSQIIYKFNSNNLNAEQKLYKDSKTILNEFVNTYSGTVRILNVVLDLTDTDFYLIPKELNKSHFICSNDLANLIYDVIKYADKFFIKELNINGNFKNKF
jgi:hypothetical protein